MGSGSDWGPLMAARPGGRWFVSERLTRERLAYAGEGYDPVAVRSASIGADCYVDPAFLEVERDEIFRRSWQFLCHEEKLREPGSYVTARIQDRGVVAVRGADGALRAFYNVCKHRGHEVLAGAGRAERHITCPYHGWVYALDGRLHRARHSERIENFDASAIALTPVQVEVFCHLVFVNLDGEAPPLAEQTEGGLAREVTGYAPDLASLTFAHRLTYTVRANWKAVVDNFLECYHCPVAHRDFVSLVEMDTYRVTTHGIWSSHMAKAGRAENSAYGVGEASVTDHAVWYLWPNTALMRYPGRGNFMVWRFVPDGAGGDVRGVRLLLRERYADGGGDGGDPVHRRGAPARGHRARRERAARDADPRLRARPLRGGPGGFGLERARGAPLPRDGARGLPPGGGRVMSGRGANASTGAGASAVREGYLAGKVAVVTGGRGGIGTAVCARFAAEGAAVYATGLSGPAAGADAGMPVPMPAQVPAQRPGPPPLPVPLPLPPPTPRPRPAPSSSTATT